MYPRKSSPAHLIWRTLSDKIRQKGLVVHKGSDVSISTQPEEERMQGDQTIETTDNSQAQMQRNYDFQIKGSEANALIKDG